MREPLLSDIVSSGMFPRRSFRRPVIVRTTEDKMYYISSGYFSKQNVIDSILGKA